MRLIKHENMQKLYTFIILKKNDGILTAFLYKFILIKSNSFGGITVNMSSKKEYLKKIKKFRFHIPGQTHGFN